MSKKTKKPKGKFPSGQVSEYDLYKEGSLFFTEKTKNHASL